MYARFRKGRFYASEVTSYIRFISNPGDDGEKQRPVIILYPDLVCEEYGKEVDVLPPNAFSLELDDGTLMFAPPRSFLTHTRALAANMEDYCRATPPPSTKTTTASLSLMLNELYECEEYVKHTVFRGHPQGRDNMYTEVDWRPEQFTAATLSITPEMLARYEKLRERVEAFTAEIVDVVPRCHLAGGATAADLAYMMFAQYCLIAMFYNIDTHLPDGSTAVWVERSQRSNDFTDIPHELTRKTIDGNSWLFLTDQAFVAIQECMDERVGPALIYNALRLAEQCDHQWVQRLLDSFLAAAYTIILYDQTPISPRCQLFSSGAGTVVDTVVPDPFEKSWLVKYADAKAMFDDMDASADDD